MTQIQTHSWPACRARGRRWGRGSSDGDLRRLHPTAGCPCVLRRCGGPPARATGAQMAAPSGARIWEGVRRPSSSSCRPWEPWRLPCWPRRARVGGERGEGMRRRWSSCRTDLKLKRKVAGDVTHLWVAGRDISITGMVTGYSVGGSFSLFKAHFWIWVTVWVTR